MSGKRWCTVKVLLLGILVAGPVQAADRPLLLTPDDQRAIDMEGSAAQGGVPRRPPVVDEKIRRAFVGEYSAVGPSKRRVFEKYLNVLGADGILDFLETEYPLCHAQAHELGRAIFARLKELGPALTACQTRCTSACMHGILMEAFARERAQEQHVTLGDVEKRMALLCSETGEMAKMHRPGNCAHGMGHALMMVAGHDVERSLTACASFKNPAMAYYCATGVFMEHFEHVDAMGGKSPGPRALHAPCDTHTRFPAACYRYAVPRMVGALKGDVSAVAAECLKLPRRQRLGCFHGLGSAGTRGIAETPALLGSLCGHGSSDDQVLCIEGAIEKLADLNESKALAACAILSGREADICRAAASEKMYRLQKPTMGLYYAQEP